MARDENRNEMEEGNNDVADYWNVRPNSKLGSKIVNVVSDPLGLATPRLIVAENGLNNSSMCLPDCLLAVVFSFSSAHYKSGYLRLGPRSASCLPCIDVALLFPQLLHVVATMSLPGRKVDIF